MKPPVIRAAETGAYASQALGAPDGAIRCGVVVDVIVDDRARGQVVVVIRWDHNGAPIWEAHEIAGVTVVEPGADHERA